jgi:hypothetical protein
LKVLLQLHADELLLDSGSISEPVGKFPVGNFLILDVCQEI